MLTSRISYGVWEVGCGTEVRILVFEGFPSVGDRLAFKPLLLNFADALREFHFFLFM